MVFSCIDDGRGCHREIIQRGTELPNPTLSHLRVLLMLTSLPGIQLDEDVAIPLVNLALCIKQLLVGDLAAGLFFVVIVTTGAWITLAVVLATRVFWMESASLDDGVSSLCAETTG